MAISKFRSIAVIACMIITAACAYMQPSSTELPAVPTPSATAKTIVASAPEEVTCTVNVHYCEVTFTLSGSWPDEPFYANIEGAMLEGAGFSEDRMQLSMVFYPGERVETRSLTIELGSDHGHIVVGIRLKVVQ